ncbi:hypothetical protein [Xanthobacter agilis]|uniref:Lipoprotein n=1 Tax=Xanthobacter agilis TaxID=47492 RepID=A0ABU0LBW1_XANAG|nr:hypothetical protein [Xanthobacter agilis]MDQ0504616.1 hypothetical protein [Xanthobacter agilis]
MFMMRPSKRTIPFRCAAAGAVALALLAPAGLAGCSGDGTVALPVPPRADVPEVAHDSYPTIGTTPHTGRPALTDAQRAKLQSDLERLSRDNAAKAKASTQNGAEAGN